MAERRGKPYIVVEVLMLIVDERSEWLLSVITSRLFIVITMITII